MKELLITIAAACESRDFLVLERNVNFPFWKKKPWQILCLLWESDPQKIQVQGREWGWTGTRHTSMGAGQGMGLDMNQAHQPVSGTELKASKKNDRIEYFQKLWPAGVTTVLSRSQVVGFLLMAGIHTSHHNSGMAQLSGSPPQA